MGHGCYYTNKETGTKAFWVEVDYTTTNEDGEEIHDDFAWNDTVDNLKYVLEAIGYNQESEYEYSNGLYQLILESTHGGDVVVRLEPSEDYQLFGLAVANHAKCYAKLGRELLKYHVLRIAATAWTSTKYTA